MVKVFTSKSGKRILEEKKSRIEIQKLIKQAKKDIEDKGSKRSKFYALHLAFIEKVKKLCSKSSSNLSRRYLKIEMCDSKNHPNDTCLWFWESNNV